MSNMIVKLTNLILGAFGNRNPYPTPKRACLRWKPITRIRIFNLLLLPFDQVTAPKLHSAQNRDYSYFENDN